jgi:hypothetical protein
MTKKAKRVENVPAASASDAAGASLPRRKNKPSKKGNRHNALDYAEMGDGVDALEVAPSRGVRKRKKKVRGVISARGSADGDILAASSKKSKSYAAADPDALNDGNTKTAKGKKSRIKKQEVALAALGVGGGPSIKEEAVAAISVDPVLLARGMTSRYIGSNIATMAKMLNPQQIQTDLEMMEGFDDACRTYSQRYFAFRNPELCCRNPDDPTGQELEYIGLNTGSHHKHHHRDDDSPPSSPSKSQKRDEGSSGKDAKPVVLPNQAMPVRIDPEEEKRIVALRKRIAQQEQTREELENQYTSLRAHYVRELQLIEAAKSENALTLNYVQQLVQKRAHVLALRKVRCQVTKDVLSSLKWRRQKQEEQENVMQVEGALEKEKRKQAGASICSKNASKDEQGKSSLNSLSGSGGEKDAKNIEGLSEVSAWYV